MQNDATSPEQEPLPPSDEFEHLGRTFQRLKEKQEAWRKLLESMEGLKTGPPHEKPEPEQPST